MTIALIVAGVVFGILALSNTFSAARDSDKWRNMSGLLLALIAAACFFIAGTMAGAQ